MAQYHYQVSVQHDRPIGEMIHSALEDLGGLHAVIPSGKRVLIKPNLVIAKTNDTGATTSPVLIEKIIAEVCKTKPAAIALGESSTAGDDTMKGYRVTGMDKIARKYGVKVIDFKKEPQVVKKIPQGKEIRKVKIAQTVYDYDYFINVPILKIHGETVVTIGMKNLKGCIHDQEKHRFHRLNLHQCIVDLNTLIQPDLTIVDATTCSLHWELGGDPLRLDTILMSKNVLAADIVAASLLGYGLEEVPHLKMATQSSLGPKSINEIGIINPIGTQITEKVEDARRNSGPDYKLSDLKVIEKGACSSCKGALVAAMRRLSREGYSPDCSVVMGQLVDQEEEKLAEAKGSGEPVVGVGRCAAKIVQNHAAKNIEGCPARAEQIYGILKKICQRS